MFYTIITKARDKWLEKADNATLTSLLSHINTQGKLRDAQVEAIKTYLYLKIECENKPLSTLFCEGKFNTLDLDSLPLSVHLREFLLNNPAALSLYEYAHSLQAHKILNAMESHFATLDYQKIFSDVFYSLSYTDYLFSLPMGAGKTYLMMCFIYLDLYFVLNDPTNTTFAHNFLILAPSGLKSSILPSLKNIEKFNIHWLIPSPYAEKIKALIKFEILDENKSSKKSNRTHNPNAAKLANYENPFGLVILTNAEKVILDKLDKESSLADLEGAKKEEWHIANELRERIAHIPHLSVFVDEVHHAASEEIKLRKVIAQWAEKGNLHSCLGFSGTPYLKSAEKVSIGDSKLAHKEIANIVYYYPLIQGINNFLKTPIVKTSSDTNRLNIVESGLREFLSGGDYNNALGGKIAIYCGSIENLEEQIYPRVCEILKDYNLGAESILKFHKGNTTYKEPQNAQVEFDNLDSKHSSIKVILLVQIGKEGWDCKSLSGVILAQEGDCPQNMVLQTSCRALRQVEKGRSEKALIYLNAFNEKKLAEQLQQEQQMSIKDFENGGSANTITLNRYDRTKQVRLPEFKFYQFKLSFETLREQEANPALQLDSILHNLPAYKQSIIETTTDFTQETRKTKILESHSTQRANFNFWLYHLVKHSFHTLSMQDLAPYTKQLQSIFTHITKDSFFDLSFDIKAINQAIRLAFAPKRSLDSKQELIPQNAQLLITQKLTPQIHIDKNDEEKFIPNQAKVEKILQEDRGELGLSPQEKQALKILKETKGNEAIIKDLESKATKTPHKDKSYHYLPYRTDSGYEREIYKEILSLDIFTPLDLEAYYNGDSHLSDFKIQVIKDSKYIGFYTPDFLILQRQDKQIYKVLIIEGKGAHLSEVFADKKAFMQDFIKQNNQKFGYDKFDYLYLQDDIHKGDELKATLIKHCERFFTRDSKEK